MNRMARPASEPVDGRESLAGFPAAERDDPPSVAPVVSESSYRMADRAFQIPEFAVARVSVNV